MKLTIQDAVGRTVACPAHLCGRAAAVRPSRPVLHRPGGLPAPQGVAPGGVGVGGADRWFLVDCPRCGRTLYPRGTMVVPEAGPGPNDG